MPTAITHVEPGSVAERLGLKEGDQLVRISGEEIIDQIDYQALTAHSRFPMEVLHADGSTEKIAVHKHNW